MISTCASNALIILQHVCWLVVSTPLKNMSQLGWLFPIYGKNKNAPNHQPVWGKRWTYSPKTRRRVGGRSPARLNPVLLGPWKTKRRGVRTARARRICEPQKGEVRAWSQFLTLWTNVNHEKYTCLIDKTTVKVKPLKNGHQGKVFSTARQLEPHHQEWPRLIKVSTDQSCDPGLTIPWLVSAGVALLYMRISIYIYIRFQIILIPAKLY